MYEQVFNLTSRPFTSTPYVKHYFPAKEIEQSLQQCKMIVDRGAGPVIVVGEHGTGKTLLLAMLEESFKSRFRVVNLSVSLMRGRADLLQSILFELNLNYRGLEESEMRLELLEFLKRDDSGDEGVLLLVDDAQKLSRETIEELQVMADFIRDGQPRVRLVLTGSQGLEDRLADSSLESFNQRIAGRCFLSCLSGDEVESYVKAHIVRAGGEPDALFAHDSYRAIREVTEGRPRYINQVCDHAMIFSSTRGLVPVSDTLIREAWFDIQQLPGSVSPSGTGAAISDTPIVSQTRSVEDSEGWTVLEFGQLDDSDAPASEDEVTETAEPVSAEETSVESSEEAVEKSVEEAAESVTTSKPQTATRFIVTPTGETVNVDSSVQESIPVEVDADESTVGADSGVPTALGGAAILASAMAGFGMSQEKETPAEMDSPTEEKSPVEEESPAEAESQEEEPIPQQFVAATETNEEVADEPVVTSLDTDTTDLPLSAVAADPFADEDFENEEVLTDAYSPFVAQQNQRSLDVTTEQLQNLTPHDVESAQETSEAEPVETEEESFPTSETAVLPKDPVREPLKREYDPRYTVETRQENEMLGSESLSDEFRVNRTAASLSGIVSQEVQSEPVSTEPVPVEAEPGSGFVPLDPNAGSIEELVKSVDTAPVEIPPTPQLRMTEPTHQMDQSDLAEAEVAASQEVETPPVMEPVAQPSPQAAPRFHEQAATPDDPAIRQQAMDIIRSLGDSDPVSQEAAPAPKVVQQETNAIEDTILRSMQAREANIVPAPEPPPVLMPEIERIQQSLQQAQMEQAQVPPVQQIPVHVDGEDSVEPERRILEEIQEQSTMMSQQVESSETLQYPQVPVSGQDDRDILEVGQEEDVPEVAAAPAVEEAAMPAWSQQEPSRGEAARVDYQQLFDQLRNIQNPEQ